GSSRKRHSSRKSKVLQRPRGSMTVNGGSVRGAASATMLIDDPCFQSRDRRERFTSTARSRSRLRRERFLSDRSLAVAAQLAPQERSEAAEKHVGDARRVRGERQLSRLKNTGCD